MNQLLRASLCLYIHILTEGERIKVFINTVHLSVFNQLDFRGKKDLNISEKSASKN